MPKLMCLTQKTARTALNLFAGVSSRKSKEVPRYAEVQQAYPLLPQNPGPISLKIASWLPIVITPIGLEDRKHSFFCRQIPITPENMDVVEAARRIVAGSLSKYGYEGWSNEIDRKNDRHASYFIVYDRKKNIVATSRMIHRREDNTLPLEQGIRPDGTHYSLEGIPEIMIDVNSFYFKRETVNIPALFLLYATMARYATLSGVNRAFCMLDPNNSFIKKLYLKAGFRFSERFTEPIYFPTFGRTVDGKFEPTYWRIMEMGPYRIMFYASLAFKYHQL